MKGGRNKKGQGSRTRNHSEESQLMSVSFWERCPRPKGTRFDFTNQHSILMFDIWFFFCTFFFDHYTIITDGNYVD